MKNVYLAVLAILFFTFGFAQSTIVTVDRANIVGPTATGNTPEITSIGFTRGTGVSLTSPSPNFTSDQWNGNSLAQAAANNDYIEWSVTASAANSIEITEFDIRNRRDATGPTSWEILYSLDNFATAGISATGTQVCTVTPVNFNFNGLSIISGIGGTITFRLYAWNATTNGGYIRIPRNNSWSDFGIANPGLRIIGSVTTTTTNSNESNITATSFDPTDNIDYTLYNATSSLNIVNAIKIGEFTVQDGGNDLSDPDALDTSLTALEFNVTGSSNIAALAIFDGVTNISEATMVTETVTFSGISGISAPDNGSKTFDVYATFNSTVNDNEQFQLTVNAASANVLIGSSFTDFDAGGAQTPITGDDNKIEVIASGVVFDQQPTDSFQFEIMTPFPTLIAVDGNGNQDLDYSDNFNVISSGSLDPSPIIYPMTNGLATFNTIVFTEKENVTTLLAFSSFFAASTSFNINGPLITIAQQDFDGSTPEWNYSTDVPTFDNGWGIDGYYGVIDAASASPLDNTSFSNNIFGENDLNDEGDNGTTGFATMSFDAIDISNFDDVTLSFDWDVHGYVSNNDDAQYRLVYDGINQPIVFLLNGNGAIDTDEGSVSINIPNTVSTVALQIRVRDNGANGYSGFDNFKLKSVFDGLLYVDNGWSPNAPSDATGSDNAYILNGTYNVGTNIEINNLYINNMATTTVSAGQSITTNSSVFNTGTLELNSVSTTFSSLITDKAQGEFVYNRHVNQLAATGSTTGENDLISAPVTNSSQTFLALRTANSNIPSGTIGGVPSFLFGPFNNNTNAFINYTTADDGSLIAPGIGYRTASTAATGSTFRFVGDVSTTTNLVPITVGTNSDFNLVGNPYPSYIKLSDFLSANTTEFSATNSGVYGYDGDFTDGYFVWNQAYSDANPTALIAPGQGFLVASKAGGGTISFTPTMRSIGTAGDFIVGREANPNLAHIKLEMSTVNQLYKTDIYFNDNASLGMDPGYDSGMFNTTVPEFALYSHLVDDNSGLNLAVQSLDYAALNAVVIPLGVHANQGEQLTISILEMDIPEGIDIYLEDTVTNTFTLLNTSEYVFTPNNNLSGTGRFFLRTSEDALSVSENNFNTIQIYTTQTPKTLFIKGELLSDTTAEIYDIQGRMISTTALDRMSTNNQIDVSNYRTGTYIVKLTNNNQQKTQKLIIK